MSSSFSLHYITEDPKAHYRNLFHHCFLQTTEEEHVISVKVVLMSSVGQEGNEIFFYRNL